MQLQPSIKSILLTQLISYGLAGPAEQEQCGEEVDRLKREALSTAQLGKQNISYMNDSYNALTIFKFGPYSSPIHSKVQKLKRVIVIDLLHSIYAPFHMYCI